VAEEAPAVASGVTVITPDWPAPPGVHACTTTRWGGISRAPYDSLNLAAHVGDAPDAVQANRRRTAAALGLPSAPVWLTQVHGDRVVDAAAAAPGATADASYTTHPGIVCAVLTADCLPVVLCHREGGRVAAVHAGWRGLAGGVIEAAVRALACPGAELLAWLGPAIGPRAYEVGDDVKSVLDRGMAGAAAALRPVSPGKWRADLYALAAQRLAGAGVRGVYGGTWCTFSDVGRFYSYRRDGETGRMATLVWMDAVTA
jgi:YfiH family protein